jgi:hypothetical protein
MILVMLLSHGHELDWTLLVVEKVCHCHHPIADADALIFAEPFPENFLGLPQGLPCRRSEPD